MAMAMPPPGMALGLPPPPPTAAVVPPLPPPAAPLVPPPPPPDPLPVQPLVSVAPLPEISHLGVEDSLLVVQHNHKKWCSSYEPHGEIGASYVCLLEGSYA